jgi:hypothetical protein
MGKSSGISRSRISFFTRTSRWAIADSCATNARAISGTLKPPTVFSVSATRDSRAISGWHAITIMQSSSSSNGRDGSVVPTRDSNACTTCCSRSLNERSRRSRSSARFRAT